ncbi:SEC-C domain-containing protein [Neobacillus sp. LXY-4]|uniref:SEC-C domain-containing protein n=1 Tax=Neobacillus sp. LXY-4 TaxID=3379826 RepID=UPI003EE3D94A
MSINRNDACPCGSGKKYKKCCLNTKKVIQIQEVKQERFFQQKKMLVEKIRRFLDDRVAVNYPPLRNEFIQRSGNMIPANVQDGFFQFWLYFCYTYKNGLRGIEWFYQDHGCKLTTEEREMVKIWTSLTLKLVEAVDQQEDMIIFEDVLTREKFNVFNIRENIPTFIPWYGTFALLENFEEKDYFNGISIFKGPTNVGHAAKKVLELMSAEEKSREQILFTYYPEILSAMLKEDYGQLDEGQTQPIHQHIIEYRILNEALLDRFVEEHKEFIVDKRDGKRKTFSYAGNWKEYQDSELQEPVLIAEVFATISIEKNRLICTGFDEQKTEELKSILKMAVLALQFVSDTTKTFEIPINAAIKNYFVQMSKTTPHYFSFYAQTDLLEEIRIPIPKFDHMSIRELIEANQKDLAETWLKQVEHNLYQQVLQQNTSVEVTADVNTVRKLLDLPLSPFVTGGAQRQTALVSIKNPFDTVLVEKEDIPFYEELGFSPNTIDNFYANDFVAFYKEKTIGKGEGTKRKYRNSLFEIRMELETLTPKSWHECDDAFWGNLIVKLTDEGVSKSFMKDFFSTIKALSKWVDQKINTAIAHSVLHGIQEAEDRILQKA